jgi:hypothetical protein
MNLADVRYRNGPGEWFSEAMCLCPSDEKEEVRKMTVKP